MTAAHVLKRGGAKEVLPVLLEALEQGQPHFATLLAHHPLLKTDSVAQARTRSLAQSENPMVRREVAYVLGRLPLRAVQGALPSLLKDADDETRCGALYSLWELGHPEVGTWAARFAGESSEPVARAGAIVSAWASKRRR